MCDYCVCVYAPAACDTIRIIYTVKCRPKRTVYISLYCDKILIMIAVERCFPKPNAMQLLHNTFITCMWLACDKCDTCGGNGGAGGCLCLAAIGAHWKGNPTFTLCIFARQTLLLRVKYILCGEANWIRGNFGSGKLKKNQCAQRKIVCVPTPSAL